MCVHVCVCVCVKREREPVKMSNLAHTPRNLNCDLLWEPTVLKYLVMYHWRMSQILEFSRHIFILLCTMTLDLEMSALRST